jgi:hypothetical protein
MTVEKGCAQLQYSGVNKEAHQFESGKCVKCTTRGSKSATHAYESLNFHAPQGRHCISLLSNVLQKRPKGINPAWLCISFKSNWQGRMGDTPPQEGSAEALWASG